LTRLGFRSRLFLILSLFSLVPAVIITLVWGITVTKVLPVVSESAAWEQIAISGQRAIVSLRGSPLSAEQRSALRAHELELEQSVTQARRLQFIGRRTFVLVAAIATFVLAIIMIIASRVAGHLSRQLSRPLQELVGWTGLIARGERLPEERPLRGAPEFVLLRDGMRAMEREIDRGRERELEAERLRAFRETAHRVAHELKNPLTPIRFAVSRLRRDAAAELQDVITVLDVETSRLDAMARSFSLFGRLPEGPASEVDLGELARYTARTVVPQEVELDIDVAEELPLVRGHHDALQRALSNVLLNAVDASGGRGRIALRVQRTGDSLLLAVRDDGKGIPAAQLDRIWEPYFTSKSGGTGLGLAIVRQTILAHHGRVEGDSVEGRGTEVRLYLPVEKTGAVVAPAST
jgi:signal transduction histidine kinase